MTEALDAMVKAMAAEIARHRLPSSSSFAGQRMSHLDIDIEKVARAGLLAIREPTEEMSDAYEASGDALRSGGFGALIDAVLNDKPRTA